MSDDVLGRARRHPSTVKLEKSIYLLVICNRL